MNEYNFRERVDAPESVEDNHEVTNSLLESPDFLDDTVPVAEALTPEVPMGGNLAAVSLLGAPIAETPVMSESVGYVAQPVETKIEEFPLRNPTPDATAAVSTNVGSLAALLNREESEHFRTRWNDIQGKFVDEPRSAVQLADGLVSEVIEKITQMFAQEHGTLDAQWNQGNDVSTEDLRKALQRYRSFFNRLVV